MTPVQKTVPTSLETVTRRSFPLSGMPTYRVRSISALLQKIYTNITANGAFACHRTPFAWRIGLVDNWDGIRASLL